MRFPTGASCQSAPSSGRWRCSRRMKEFGTVRQPVRFLINAATVARVRKRFVEEGLEAAINDKPRPGRERKLDGKQEARLVAITCSSPPEGHVNWTLHLLADKVVELEFAGSISLETVRQILKKTNSSRGGKRNGASPS